MHKIPMPDFRLFDSDSSRLLLYEAVAKTYDIHYACYPGSSDDIMPSLFIPSVIYIDSAQIVCNFFCEKQKISEYLEKNKTYSGYSHFQFYFQDYQESLQIQKVDLLISQYAGNVGQIMKKYLRPGGILLVADGNQDAPAAMQDPEYELLGTVCMSTGPNNDAYIEPGIRPKEYASIDCDGIQMRIPIPRNFCFQKIST